MFRLALFGESQRGEFHAAYLCKNLEDLSHYLGEPPSKESKGLAFAIQALLFKRDVIFFRVHEEGFSTQDYIRGFQLLEDKNKIPEVSAICLPGVGNAEIIEATTPFCKNNHNFLILTEQDLYDYLTFRSAQ